MTIHSTITTTHGGTKVNLAAPTTAMINLRDLAWHLTNINADPAAQFPYTLAQRAVILSEALAKEEGALAALYGLLDGASQAYTRNIDPRALNAAGGDSAQALCGMWQRLDGAIHAAFELDWPVPKVTRKAVETARLRLRITELRCLRSHVDEEIAAVERSNIRPLPRSIVYWKTVQAHDRFLDAWRIYAAAAHLPATPAWGGAL